MTTLNITRTLRALSASWLIAFSSISAGEPVPLDHVVAVVDDDIIMQSDIDKRIISVKQQNANVPSSDTLRQQVLERLIVESVQLQMAARAGVRISDAKLNQTVEAVAAQNKRTIGEFRQAMNDSGIGYNYAREQIHNDLKMQEVQRFQVAKRIQITDKDVDYFLNSDLGKVSSGKSYELGHILVAVPENSSPADRERAQKKAQTLVEKIRAGEDFRALAIAESDGRNALKGGDLGWRKEVQLPTIFTDVVPQLKKGQVSAPIKSASGFHLVMVHNTRGGQQHMVKQTKVRHILIQPNELRDDQESQRLINTLYERAKLGEDIGTLAKTYSDDPGSANLDGDLGWVESGKMVPKFEQVMNATQEQRISAPFKSTFGWHILKVDARRTTDVGEQMQRQQVRQMLFSKRFEEELPIWLRKIRSEAYVDIKQR